MTDLLAVLSAIGLISLGGAIAIQSEQPEETGFYIFLTGMVWLGVLVIGWPWPYTHSLWIIVPAKLIGWSLTCLTALITGMFAGEAYRALRHVFSSQHRP